MDILTENNVSNLSLGELLVIKLIELICNWVLSWDAFDNHWLSDFCYNFIANGSNPSVNDTLPNNEPVEVPNVYRQILLALFILTFAASLMGNIVVLLVLVIKKSVRFLSSTYVVSLAISNVVYTAFSIPTDLIALLSPYDSREDFFSSQVTGDVMCKMARYFIDLAMFANVFTLVGLSFERYLAVVHPLKARSLQPAIRTVSCLVLVWSLSIVFALPAALLYHWTEVTPELSWSPLNSAISNLLMTYVLPSVGNELTWYECRINNRPAILAYRWLQLIVLLVLPVLAMSFSYVNIGMTLWARKRQSQNDTIIDAIDLRYRTAKRVVFMMTMACTMFMISYAPALIYELVGVSVELQFTSLTITLRFFFRWLLASNCVYNPLLHTFLHENFRRSFTDVLLCRKRARIQPVDVQAPSPASMPRSMQLAGTNETSDPPIAASSLTDNPAALGCSDLLTPPSFSERRLLTPPPKNDRGKENPLISSLN